MGVTVWLCIGFLFVSVCCCMDEPRVLLSGNQNFPDEWKPLHSFGSQVTMTKIYIAFHNRNIKWLRETLAAVSDPFSRYYGAYPSSEEVTRRTGPTVYMIGEVSRWLESVGVYIPQNEITTAKTTGYLPVELQIQQAEKLLDCKFTWYKHTQTHLIIPRSLRYSIPANLEFIVALVGGVDHFPMKRLDNDNSFVTPPESSIVNPAAIRNHYNISSSLMGMSSQNSNAVAEYDNQWFDETDLSLFFQRNNLPDTHVAKTVGFNNGTTGADGGEADLDIQYLMGVGVNVPTWFISLDNTFGDGFLEWIILLLGLGDDAPLLHSTSYGADERFISASYLDRVSEDLMKFGTTGHTLFFSSGDFGVGCDCSRPEIPKYVAHFPASSPYVTSIGGTISLPTVNGTEVGVTFSGGGFSNHFARQSYQESAVGYYLNTSSSLPPASFYNASNRGYPDMSAWALNYEIYEHGHLDYIGGTSASTPAVAGMFSLINDLRLQQNLPPLGFLNPSLYTMIGTNCFNDIQFGNNGDQPCCEGFTAQKGWDPMTGLGSPNFSVLQSFFTQSFPLKKSQ